MSLVGTRPPTVDEWEQYELHHRSRMSTKDNRIVIVSKTNGGLVDATIAGVKAARGEYTVYLHLNIRVLIIED